MALLSVLLIMMVYCFPIEESIRTARFSPLHLSSFTMYLLSPVHQQLVSFHSPHTSCSLSRARVSFILFSLWLFSPRASPLFCLPPGLRSEKAAVPRPGHLGCERGAGSYAHGLGLLRVPWGRGPHAVLRGWSWGWTA